MAISFGRRATPIGIPSIEEVQDIAQQVAGAAENAADATAALVLLQVEGSVTAAETAAAEAATAASTAATDAVTAAQPAIEAATQQAAAAVAPAAADAIRAQVATDADRAEGAAVAAAGHAAALPAERDARAVGDERWPTLMDPVADHRHVQINTAGQVIAYTDAAGREWAWDEAAAQYLPPVDVSAPVAAAVAPVLAVEAEARTAGDERWPGLPLDYLGNGARHAQVNAAGQVVAYTDAAGLDWRWDATAATYIAAGQDFTPEIEALSARIDTIEPPAPSRHWWDRTNAAADGWRQLRQFGVALPDGPVVAPPANSVIPQWSEDHATWGTFVTQCIPFITQAGRRMWRSEYGRIGVTLPANGEGDGSYLRLSYCDMDQPGGIASGWVKAGYFLVQQPTDQIKDSPIFGLPDGRMLIYIPTYRSGVRTHLGLILNNAADGMAGNWSFTQPTYLTPGLTALQHFAMQFYWHGAEIRNSLNIFHPVAEGDYDPVNLHRIQIRRVRVYANTYTMDDIGTVPYVPFALASYQEASFAPFGRGSLLATMRTTAGAYYSVNHEGGKDGAWSAPQPVGFVSSPANTKTSLSLSPLGNQVFVFSRSTSRTNMSIAVSRDGFQTLLVDWTLDPGVGSYPSVMYGRNPDHSYSGKIYIAYDRGRGTASDPDNPGAYLANIVILEIDEEAMLSGSRTAIRHEFLPSGEPK